MNILFISPGFPMEMPRFVRGLASVGVGVVGIGEQPQSRLPELARESLAHYHQVDSLWDESSMIGHARQLDKQFAVDGVECLWEPGMTLAARIREALDLPGMGFQQTLLFRDKERMKQTLDASGIRTPRHRSALGEVALREAAEEVGYPLIVKPIAGAGSADTYRMDEPAEFERMLPKLRRDREMSVEEFIDGEEFTFDTICAEGRILYYNVAWYRPQPLIARTVEWISAQTVSLRNPQSPRVAAGVEMGRRVLSSLGFRDGFTHMEWFLREDGEAVFGEIAARPPGAMSVDLMNFACDLDTYSGWAEAICRGRLGQTVERRYNAAVIFKRARGQGKIRRITGLERLVARYRPHIVAVDLLPVGAPRRNWKQTLLSDGHLVVRHPDLGATLEMADRIGTDLQLEAG